MKRYINAFAMCQSMFCAIPFPWNVWDEDARDKMLLFLPAVGLEIGFFCFLAWLVCCQFALPVAVRALIMTALPFVLTGFIHLDGFMDVNDAIKSCRNLEKRRAILKDPHVGSFAVISCVLLLLCHFALFLSIESGLGILVFIPAVSRCCSAIGITLLKPMSTSQYAELVRHPIRAYVLIAMLAFFVLAGFLLCGLSASALLGCMLGCGISILNGYRKLDGMNGDISGYAITVGEIWGVAVLALMGGFL